MACAVSGLSWEQVTETDLVEDWRRFILSLISLKARILRCALGSIPSLYRAEGLFVAEFDRTIGCESYRLEAVETVNHFHCVWNMWRAEPNPLLEPFFQDEFFRAGAGWAGQSIQPHVLADLEHATFCFADTVIHVHCFYTASKLLDLFL